ncbi:MAG: ParB/RepB/Spo0J family partition protein [Patescibacteria group bacterium]|nr:ParB/RepB/Spo0J family partition protein [Patescibacteria group bacterium]
MAQKGGLGRGLVSLIPNKKKSSSGTVNYFGMEVDVSEGEKQKEGEPSGKKEVDKKTGTDSSAKITDVSLKSIIETPIETISPNPYQPRKNFDEGKLKELSDSIKKHGVLQPLVVSRKDDGSYELIAGERRLEASKIAGLAKVPVVVRVATEQNKMELALIENVQRHNLNVVEEAKAYKKMQDTFALTQEEIADRVGKSRSAVANILRLLKLPVEILKALGEGKIAEGHARTILGVSNSEKQRAFYELILKENLNVRQAEDRVREATVKTNPRKLKSLDPEIQSKQEELSELLGTKVKIRKSNDGKGQVTIEFYSNEDFSSLINKLTLRQ